MMLIWESFITIVWLFARVHVEAFSAFGQVPHVGGSKIQLGAMTSTRTPPLISKVPCQESTFGQERRGCVPMQLSTADSDVDSPVGKSNTEGHSAVLDSLIEQFTSPENGNITATVEEYLDLCDHALLTRLRGRIESEGDHSTLGTVLTRVEEEINMAMQRRLATADANLRRVLISAPDIKKMEGTVRILFREGKVDMAFMVMVSMNLQRAQEAEGAENAVMLLRHLTTFIMGLQDERLNPETKLLRVLLRTDCDGVRKSMLLDRLQLPNHDIFLERPPDGTRVQPHLLHAEITDIIAQAEELSLAVEAGLLDSLHALQLEIRDVVKGSQRPGPFRQ